MDKKILKYKSDTSGLWIRFITKLITIFPIAYFLSVIIGSFLAGILGNNFFIIIFLFVLLGGLIYVVIKDNPINWGNQVIIDFENNVITLANASIDLKDKERILDFNGFKFGFEEIEYYSVVHYDSFLFSSYYLVKIFARGKELKLISFKNANEFKDFNGVLKHRINLKSR